MSCRKYSAEWPVVDPVPLALTKAQMEYVANGNDFACKLLALVDEKESGHDYVFSPLSVQIALSMLLNGTDGEAFTELCQVLGYGKDLQSVNDFCQQMITRAPTWDPKVKLALANAMVGNSRYTFKAPYTNTLKTFFSAEVSVQDFSQTNKVLKYINDWCNQHTYGMIHEILDELDPSAVLCLMNALYFKGEWSFPFDKEKTAKEAFHKENGKTFNVYMMNAGDLNCPYAEGPNWKSIVLPYGNGTFRMQIILPTGEASIHDIVSQIKTSGWSAFENKQSTRNIQLKLPRFETIYNEDRFLDYIHDLGAKQISKPGYFSSITDDGNFSVSLAVHRARINVSESGTEAAAATLLTDRFYLTLQEPFYCDHPFLYAIVENTTGAIFFMGKYGGN